jgi:hypothetical protein
VFFPHNLVLKNISSAWGCLELHAQVTDRCRVYDSPFSIGDFIVLNESVIDEYCPGIFLEEKSQNLLAGTVHVPPESRNGHLPYTSLGHHSYANMLGKTHRLESLFISTTERTCGCAVDVS